MFNRRQLILAGALLPACRSADERAGRARVTDDAGSWDLPASVPDYSALFTLRELRERVHRLRVRHPALVRVQTLGLSKRGEPIELISLGSGRRSALLIAGMHPNEPLGSLTSDFLLEFLIREQRLRETLDFTWHFINPIDPDGMQLNESWFKGQLTPERYFGGFFRPALARQAEYTFPLDVASVRFDTVVPENMAWRRAIELTKPQLQYTLHNAEFGGAFFLTSQAFPELERQLQSLPAAFGLALNSVGEPLSDLPQRAEGIFALPLPAQMIGAIASKLQGASAAQVRSFWPAGDSSTAYASRFGTFSLSTEAPYWDDARVFDASPSNWTLAGIIVDYLRWNEEGADLLERCGAWLDAAEGARSEHVYALREHLTSWRGRATRLRAALDAGAFDTRPLSVREAALYRTTMRLTVLRPFAIIVRITEGLHAQPVLPAHAAEEAHALIRKHLRDVRAESDLHRVPLRASVGVQAAAALVTAKLLSSQA
jgi:hypothetical protein